MPPVSCSPADLLTATGDHPYVRSSLRQGGLVQAVWQRGPAVVWIAAGRPGAELRVLALGPPDQVAALLTDLASALPEEASLSVPRGTAPLLTGPVQLAHRSEWNFRWTYQPPPAVRVEHRVRPLPEREDGEVGRLLDAAAPGSSARPGAAHVRRWLGLRCSGRLVAVAADTSAGGVGHVSSVTTDVTRRGRGLGAAVTAALSRRLHAEFGLVTLGVYQDNTVADRLYVRLGFVGEHLVTSGPRRTT